MSVDVIGRWVWQEEGDRGRWVWQEGCGCVAVGRWVCGRREVGVWQEGGECGRREVGVWQEGGGRVAGGR